MIAMNIGAGVIKSIRQAKSIIEVIALIKVLHCALKYYVIIQAKFTNDSAHCNWRLLVDYFSP